MDLKIWLRYQLSGSVYIAWFLIFYYSSNSYDLTEVTTKIFAHDVFKIFAAGIPIGAIIHQFSVSFKNQVLGGWFGFEFFQDSMVYDGILTDGIIKQLGNNRANNSYNNSYHILNKSIVKTISTTQGTTQLEVSNGSVPSELINSKITAVHEKLSALNTFYYMRMDNGFFAPVLAFISYLLVVASANDDLPIFTYYLIVATICLVFLLRGLGLIRRDAIKITSPEKESIKLASIKKYWLILVLSLVVSVVCLFISSFTLGVILIIILIIVFLLSFIIKSKYIACTLLHTSLILLLIILATFLTKPLFHQSNYEFNYKKYITPIHHVQIVQTSDYITYESIPNLPIKYTTDVNGVISEESKVVYEYELKEPINEFVHNQNQVLQNLADDHNNEITFMSKTKDNQKYDISRVNGNLLPCVIALCLLYMLALLSYIPIIYYERRDTWKHYV